MRTKGKPSCGGWGCDPCNAITNPCFKMVLDGPITKVLDIAPTDYTVEATESFDPADLPRDLRYRCIWNPSTGQYDCNYITPGPTDLEFEIEALTIQDRYGDDILYRSVNYSNANNLCEGQRWYAGTANQFPLDFNGIVFGYPATCKADAPDTPPGAFPFCNWGVLPGHVGNAITGPWSPTFSMFFKWQRVTVGGVKKVRITAYSGDHHGWWGETDFYRAGSTPTAPLFWWQIPDSSPIRLAWTPTVQDDGSEPIDNPGGWASTATFLPWPDLLLTSCSNTFPTDCSPISCLPQCVVQNCGGVNRRRPLNLTVTGCPDLAALAPATFSTVDSGGFQSGTFGYGATSPPGAPPVALILIQYSCTVDGLLREVFVTDTDAASYSNSAIVSTACTDGSWHDTFSLSLIDCSFVTFDVFSDGTDPWEYL